MNDLDQVLKLIEQRNAIENELQKNLKNNLKEMIAKCSVITAIEGTGYIPSFNDGDVCRYSFYVGSIALSDSFLQELEEIHSKHNIEFINTRNDIKIDKSYLLNRFNGELKAGVDNEDEEEETEIYFYFSSVYKKYGHQVESAWPIEMRKLHSRCEKDLRFIRKITDGLSNQMQIEFDENFKCYVSAEEILNKEYYRD